MKKLFYILGIGLLMASCTEDFKDWADPQSNSESSKSVSSAAVAAGAIDYNSVTTDSVTLFTPTYNAGEDVTASNLVTVYNADKSYGITLEADAQGRVDADELRDALENLYGQTTDALTVPVTVETVLNDNGQGFKFVSEINSTITPTAGMYLIVNGEKNRDYPMKLQGTGVYTISIPVPKNDAGAKLDMEVLFAPYVAMAGNFDANKLGSDIVTDGLIDGGTLAQGAEAYAIRLDADDDYNEYTITVNTVQGKYDIAGLAYADMIWQAGNANGWGSPAAGLKNKGWKDAKDDGDYYGFMYLDGDFKFRSQQNSWDAPDWGAGETEGTLQAQAGNLNAEAGFYMVEANIANLTYKLTPITTIGVIGSFPDNNWGSDVLSLVYNTATGAWEGTVEIPAGVEFKFRANQDWGINWGGDINDLAFDAGNISLGEGGTYFIQLFITYQGDFHVIFKK